MESEVSYLAWLHENTAYTFNGDAPIAGLTVREETALQLGHIINAERKKEQQRHGGARRKYSKPRRSTKEAMNDFANRYDKGVQ